MDSTFGTRLRLQREGQQIPLATIAEQTKIKLSLLEGLERDDLSRWPTGIFRRSYFRAYARAIGLDTDGMLSEFRALYPDPETSEDVTHVLAQAQQINGQTRRPPTRLRCLIDSAVSALPALHLQPTFKSAPSGVRTQKVQPVEPVEEIQPVEPVEEEPIVEVSHPAPTTVHEEPGVDLSAVAQLCTRLARALDICDVTPVLEEAVKVLRAVGLILWVRDRLGCELMPVIAHGYSSQMTSQLARVSRDSDNAIALAFRTAETRVVNGSDMTTGAVVVPLMTPTGCAGVLALELRNGEERRECVCASATILAAQLSTLVGVPVLAEAVGA